MTQDVVVGVQVAPLGLAVAMYSVMGAPPLFTGGSHVTVSFLDPAVAVTLVGASGSPTTVTAADGADAVDVPTALVAVAVNVYDVRGVRPVKLHSRRNGGMEPTGSVQIWVAGWDVTS
jgi:hypothetical protein